MATKINRVEDRGQLFYVLADGKFHQEVPEGTEGAVRREYETSDGAKGVKYEILVHSIEGTITHLSLFEGDYGKNVMIHFGDEDPKETVTISLNLNSNYGEEFLKRLPNIDLSKEVKLTPYSFENEQGKTVRGINVEQGGEKIFSYYHDYDKKTKKTTVNKKNGYPELPEQKMLDKWDSDDWKMYFTKARKFMIGELQKHEAFVEELPTSSQSEEAPADNTEEEF